MCSFNNYGILVWASRSVVAVFKLCSNSIHFECEIYRGGILVLQENFVKVIHNQEFLLLSADDLRQVLSSDDINVPNEETVFHALITWTMQDPSRSSHLAKLLAHVRLPLIPPQVPIFCSFTLCICLILE